MLFFVVAIYTRNTDASIILQLPAEMVYHDRSNDKSRISLHSVDIEMRPYANTVLPAPAVHGQSVTHTSQIIEDDHTNSGAPQSRS
jgi:hypothetical protein